MEVSNRALTIVGIAVCVAVYAARSHSSPTVVAAGAATPTQSAPVTSHHRIPDSDFSVLNNLGTSPQSTEDLGTPNANLIRQDQAGVVPPPSTSTPPQAPQVDQTAPDDQAVDTSQPDDTSSDSMNLDWANDEPVTSHGILSDRLIFDQAVDMMPEDTRDERPSSRCGRRLALKNGPTS